LELIKLFSVMFFWYDIIFKIPILPSIKLFEKILNSGDVILTYWFSHIIYAPLTFDFHRVTVAILAQQFVLSQEIQWY